VGLTDNGLNYSYSVGFSQKFKHPEVMIVGVGDEKLHLQLINAYGDMLKTARRPEPSSYVDLPGFGITFAVGPVVAKELVRPHAGFGTELLGGPFDAMQLYLPDPKGLFPWDANVHPIYREAQGLMFGIPKNIQKPLAN